MDHPKPKPWHAQPLSQVYETLHSSEDGLRDAEATERLQTHGPNTLRAKPPKSILRMLKEQLLDPMVLILIGAALFSALLQEWTEAIVIGTIVVVNAVIGIVQEKKAQSSLEALRNMRAPTARVLREGEESILPASELVPGDIVFLRDGDMVPADLRLVDAANLKVQEASLTGESVPSEKDADVLLAADCPLGDRCNMLYASSIVTYGRATGVVVATGMDTQVGNIADLLAYIDYNGGKITESAIHSVFDLLYEPYAEARREFLKRHRRISEFDSENLTYALLERVLETDPAFRHLGVLCHQPLRQLIRDWMLLNDEERRYASNGATHLDFLIYNRVSKRPVLAVETDGYRFHKQGTRQSERDRMKDRILDRYGLPLLRLSTTGTDEEAKIHTQLTKLLQR